MTWSKLSAQNKVTRPLPGGLWNSCLHWDRMNCVWGVSEGGVLGVFGFETGGAPRPESDLFVCLFFGGGGGMFLRKKIRIKEFNPRLIYFHYLQD